MIFPSSLFKGKDEKNDAQDFEKILSEKDAEIASLRKELELLRSETPAENEDVEYDDDKQRAKRVPISLNVLRDILQNTFNRIERNNKAPRYSILNLLNVINYTQPSDYDKVPAMQEINYIKSYIEIRKHSSSSHPTIRFSYAPTLRRQLVYSGLFMPIVDYAFKHTTVGTLLDVKIIEIDNSMIMDVIMPQAKNTNTAFAALSPEFQKLKKRLNELYPNNHTFEIKSLASNLAIRLGIKYEKTAVAPRQMEDFDSEEYNKVELSDNIEE